MLPELLQRISLFQLLYRIDLDLAASHRQKGCPHCSGPLHQANYLRKPRGGHPQIPEEYCVRLSLCCGREGCRHRSPPPSCMFMGRKVYWRCVILVVAALRQRRPDGISAGRLSRMFSIPRKTLMRWFDYFREYFPVSAAWQRVRGRMGVQVIDSELPGSLLDYFIEQSSDTLSGFVGCVRFLAS
jgi:hypothetical protein